MQHGTKVILLGKSDDENTFAPPEHLGGQLKTWLVRYLNSRYFELPSGIELGVREDLKIENGRVSNKGFFRRITGMKKFLDDNCKVLDQEKNIKASGVVALRGAKAHWWISGAEGDSHLDSHRYHINGHVGALYQGEIYEMSPIGKASTAALQQLGIHFGSSKVVIYIEPTDLSLLTANTARTHLLLGRDHLPWADWAAQFRSSLPKELDDHVKEHAPKVNDAKVAANIDKRLQSMAEFAPPSAYRRAKKTDHAALSDVGTTPIEAVRLRSEGTKAELAQKSSASSAAGAMELFAKGKGQLGRPVKAMIRANFKFVSVEDGSREPGDMEDRAGRYLEDQNLLLINADYRGIWDQFNPFLKIFSRPDQRQVVIDYIREWYAQGLVEYISLTYAYSDSSRWTEDETRQMRSEVGITAGSLRRYLDIQFHKKSLATKLGKPNGDEAEERPRIPAPKQVITSSGGPGLGSQSKGK